MYYIKSYRNVQSARVALQSALNQMGFKLADVDYEIKRMKASRRFHPVLNQRTNGKHMLRQLEAKGFVVTH